MSAALRQPRIIAVALLAMSLLTPLLTSAQADARPAAEPERIVDTLRLDCQVDSVDGERGVLCRWSASERDGVRGYQLYRIVNGSPRELVATVAAGERLHAFDADIGQGDRLIYGVVARNGNGRMIGLGGPVRLGIPR